MRGSHLPEAGVRGEGWGAMCRHGCSADGQLTPASPPRVCRSGVYRRLRAASVHSVALGLQAGGVGSFPGPPCPGWLASSWCSSQKVFICVLFLCYLAESWEFLPLLTLISEGFLDLWVYSLQATLSFTGCIIVHRLF